MRRIWNGAWAQIGKEHCETLLSCGASSSIENELSRSVYTLKVRVCERDSSLSFFLFFFFCYLKCFVATDVQPLNLMHHDIVSTEREPWTISAWLAAFRESVGKPDIFIFMLASLHNTEKVRDLV